MAVFDLPRPAAAGPGLRPRLSAFIGHLTDWNDARVTRRALSKLSAHELDDIGLHRGDIDEIARRGLRR